MTSSNGNFFFILLAFWDGNPTVPGGFPSQRPATRGFDVFFDLCLNKQLGKNHFDVIVMVVAMIREFASC